MSLRQRHWIALFAVISQFALGCGTSSDAARSSDAGAPGTAGNDQASGGGSAVGGASSRGGSPGGVGGNTAGNHTTGLVKLNLKVK